MKWIAGLFMMVSFIACQSSATAQQGKVENVDVSTFKSMMQNENVVVLDVRTPDEIAQGKIDGALEINIKAADFEEKIAALPKDKTYLVYCRSGSRSSSACAKMETMGFEHLVNMKGGFLAWAAE